MEEGWALLRFRTPCLFLQEKRPGSGGTWPRRCEAAGCARERLGGRSGSTSSLRRGEKAGRSSGTEPQRFQQTPTFTPASGLRVGLGERLEGWSGRSVAGDGDGVGWWTVTDSLGTPTHHEGPCLPSWVLSQGGSEITSFQAAFGFTQKCDNSLKVGIALSTGRRDFAEGCGGLGRRGLQNLGEQGGGKGVLRALWTSLVPADLGLNRGLALPFPCSVTLLESHHVSEP